MMDINVRVPLQLATTAIDHMAAHGGGALPGGFGGRQDRRDLADHAAGLRGVEGRVAYAGEMAIPECGRTKGIGQRGGARARRDADDPRVQLGPTLPMGRIGRPEELAWPIAFLCTSAASYLSGAILDVNGGAFVGP